MAASVRGRKATPASATRPGGDKPVPAGILSMTGHGRATLRDGEHVISVECSSVNRKGLEIAIQLPREISGMEPLLRSEASGHLRRGRLSIFVSLTPAGNAGGAGISIAAARAALENLRTIAHELGLPEKISMEALLRHPAISCASHQQAPPPSEDKVLACLRSALVPFIEMRTKEGAHLAEELLEHAHTLDQLREEIAGSVDASVESRAEALRGRIARLIPSTGIDPARIEQEVVLFADRCDITEELARLASHIARFREALASGDSPGRTLEFLTQELGREINTCGSKSSSVEISQLVIRAKSTLEKIREQLANVE